MKWEIPFSPAASSRLPVSIHTPRASECAEGTCSVMTRSPEASVDFRRYLLTLESCSVLSGSVRLALRIVASLGFK
jgi:hypothetical protein